MCLSDSTVGGHTDHHDRNGEGCVLENSYELPRRRASRLYGYDYTLAGAYYVTICTYAHQRLFGQVVGCEMRLNDAGRMLEHWWDELHNAFPCVELDVAVVMPNHLHGIIVIDNELGDHEYMGTNGEVVSLPSIMQWLKTMTTNEYIRCVKSVGWPPFAGKVWHRSYYDHIIRNEDDLLRIRNYIINNPAQWAQDAENR